MPNRISTIIVEDEKRARQALEDLIQMVGPDIEVVATANSVNEAIEAIEKHNPKLLFLDIQLGEERSFRILYKLKEYDFHIIFVTAFDEYAVKAFQFSAIDYLLKPINPNRLKDAIDKVRKRLEVGNMSEELETLVHNLQSKDSRVKRIVLSTQDFIHVVNFNEIVSCQSSVNYTQFRLTDGKEILIAKTLKEYEEQLSPFGFLRVHKSWLINLDHVVGFDRKDGGFAKMRDGLEIPVSPARKEEFMRLL